MKNRRQDNQGGRARTRRAFTLLEVLISIAILGVGMAMVAALFPAGLLANRNSANDLIGQIICQNGEAIAKAALSDADLQERWPGSAMVDLIDLRAKWLEPYDEPVYLAAWVTNVLDMFPKVPKCNWNYPMGRAKDSPRGILVLGRRPDPNTNDYQLIIIAYAKSDKANHEVIALDIDNARNWTGPTTPIMLNNDPCEIAADSDRFDLDLIPINPGIGVPVADRHKLVGSVLLTTEGQYAYIEKIESQYAILDRVIDTANPAKVSHVVIERTIPGNDPNDPDDPAKDRWFNPESEDWNIAGARSPVMFVTTTRGPVR